MVKKKRIIVEHRRFPKHRDRDAKVGKQKKCLGAHNSPSREIYVDRREIKVRFLGKYIGCWLLMDCVPLKNYSNSVKADKN